jgi:hypothetical protein
MWSPQFSIDVLALTVASPGGYNRVASREAAGTLGGMGTPPRKRKGKDVTTTAPDRHRGRQLPTRIGESLNAVLEAEAKKERRSVAQMGLILLEEALTTRGVWPPKEGGGD